MDEFQQPHRDVTALFDGGLAQSSGGVPEDGKLLKIEEPKNQYQLGLGG